MSGLVDPIEPVFRADDEALLRGNAAFETLPVYGGRPFELERHLARLTSSLLTLGLPPIEEGAAAALAASLVEHAGGDFVLRLYRTSSSLVATAAAIPDDLEELRARGLRIHVVETGLPAGLVAGAKATSTRWRSRRSARPSGRGATTRCCRRRRRPESPTSNVWWRVGDSLDAGDRGRRAAGGRGPSPWSSRATGARGTRGPVPARRAPRGRRGVPRRRRCAK
jgi:hypothetical protein